LRFGCPTDVRREPLPQPQQRYGVFFPINCRVIDTLVKAVRNGELDDALAHAANQAPPKESKKAARNWRRCAR
jgi:hypothetical protein